MKAFSAFFMCPVSHTFPAYNGNVMPRRVSTGDACAPFYGLRKLFFLCAVLRGCAGVEGAFALGGVPSCPREEKRLPRPLPARGARLQTDAEPGYFPPQTLRLSAGRSNHSGLFRWKNLAQFFPTLRRELTKKKGRGTMSTTPHGLPLCLACWLAQGLFLCHQAAPGRMTRDGR